MARRLPAHIVLPNGMWRFVKGKGSKARTRKTKRKGERMARRGKRRSSRKSSGMGGFSVGRLLTPKNLMFTLGAAILLPKVIGVDSRLAAAAGGFMGAGIMGAAAGYFAAPMVLGIVGQNGGSDTLPAMGGRLIWQRHQNTPF